FVTQLGDYRTTRQSPTFFFQAEDGIRDGHVTGVQTCAIPIYLIVDSAFGPIARAFTLAASSVGRAIGPKAQSTIRWPSSVRNGRSEERGVGKEGGARGGRDLARRNAEERGQDG